MKKLYIIFMLAIIGLSSAFAQVHLDSGLVGYWPFNGNANDASGNSNNGTVTNATLTTDRFGNANSAYYFNGTNAYITVPNSTSLNPQNAITMCAWYYSATFVGDGYNTIIEKNYTSFVAPYYQYKLGVCGNHSSSAYYHFGSSVTTNSTVNSVTTINNFWTAGNWYFLVCTYDGSNLKFFVNNQLIISISATGLINTYNTPIYFGGYPTESDYTLGAIDDIRIYNRALNTGEIAALYYDCSGMPAVSFTGLNSSYTSSSTAVALTGIPSGGTFYGPGITGNTFNPAYAGIGSQTVAYVYAVGGCSKAICEETSLTSIKNIEVTDNIIKVYPSPANDYITIENSAFAKDQTISLYDIQGQLLKQQPMKQAKINIDISTLPSGIYVVEVKTKKGVGVRKFVKE